MTDNKDIASLKSQVAALKDQLTEAEKINTALSKLLELNNKTVKTIHDCFQDYSHQIGKLEPQLLIPAKNYLELEKTVEKLEVKIIEVDQEDIPPTSQPPTSQPPTSKPPTSKPPTSQPPTSQPPTSKPPTSQPPTSKPPTK